MLTTDINIEDRLINGQMETVKQKENEIKENEVRAIYLGLDDKYAGQIRMSGCDVIAKNNKWVPVKREETSIYLGKYKSTSPAIKRTQFPLVLFCACAVHKVQGLSLTSAVISFDLEKQKSFNEGQMYVALSRVTSIDNLFVIGKNNCNVFRVNESAVVEYSRLRKNRFDTIYTDYVDCNSLTISLLDTRSLKRHAADISRATRLTENDILCLIESQITNDADLADIKEQLSFFEIYFNSCCVRHENLAFCLGQNIVFSKHEIFPGIPVIDITNINLQVHLSLDSLTDWKIY